MDRADLDLFERSLRHATGQHTGPALDAALDALGWRDALAVDRRAAVSILFELQGQENVSSSALDHVLRDALGLDAAPPAVVLPRLGRWTPPGRLDDGRLHVAGLGTAAVHEAGAALVVFPADSKDVAAVVATGSLGLRSVRGIDPSLGLVEVTGERIDGVTPEPVAGWDRAVAVGQLAVGHQLVGASRRMLDLARDHALERIQFGQPIGRFQAVRHRLAETLIAVETADAALDGAWLDGAPLSAAIAKSLAGRGARIAARHCQQVLAGIGFTTEHELHRYVRRVFVLDELLGGSRPLTADLGRHLLDSRQLPGLLPL
jgi:hypothetical protein